MGYAGEVMARYAQALADNGVYVGVAAGAAVGYVVAASWAEHRRPKLELPRWTPIAGIALLCVLAIAWAWRLRWIADDAFISFRYARNWAEGHGLVFNVGERVEGYTDFLWTAILAGADRVGLDIPAVAVGLCLASHVGVLIVTTRLVRALVPGRRVIVSLAAIVLASSYLTASFATGGLETMLASLLVLGAVERARSGVLLSSGALGVAAILAHPDHGIFYVALGVVLALRRTRPAAMLRYAAPFILVFVPYFIARWRYYGAALPNTYYAKDGGGAYFTQGGLYLLASVAGAGLAGVMALATLGVVRRIRELPAQVTALAVPLYLFYVAKIGGDFMLGRLLVPVLPLCLVYAELAARELIARGRWQVATVALGVASLACVPTRIIGSQQIVWFMSDERTFHPLETLLPLELEGSAFHRAQRLERYFGDVRPSPVYAAYAIGIVGWITRWRIVDLHGLVDPALARQPLTERGRPGHEHVASRDLIYRRGADISATSIYDPAHDDLCRLIVDGETFFLTRYRADWLDRLRGEPAVRFARFPDYLDSYLATIERRDPESINGDLAFFDRYYFATNPDPPRRDRLRAAAVRRAAR